MSEEAIRCSKCGGTVSGETCTACGAEGQAKKCEHCGGLCPGDAQWCPSCGRRLKQAGAAASSDGDQTMAGGGSIPRLMLLLGLIVVACILIWKYTPTPAPTVVAALAALAAIAPGALYRRLSRVTPLLVGAAMAAVMVCLVTQHSPTIKHLNPKADPAPAANVVARDSEVAGVVIARFKDGGLDEKRVWEDIAKFTVPKWAPVRGAAYAAFIDSDIEIIPSFNLSEEINNDTHDVTIHFNPRIPDDFVIDALKDDPNVVFAEPDYIYHALYTPNDPHFDEPYDSREGPVDQWYLPKIAAPQAWDALKGTNSNIRLAIIDTGIDYTHPDLKNMMARDSKGAMIGKSFIRGRPDYLDDNGHGTHCAGIANAETDNNTGVAGVGFNSFRIVAAKVLTGKGYGQVDWISNAITWCADNGCRVETMSLGGGTYSQAMQDAVNYAWKKNVIVIAAAGNSQTSQPGYPAGNNHVIAVSATNRDDRLAGFSNYGTPISVGAPGVSILATMPTYECDLSRRGLKLNYDSLAGTSMACPVVAGTFAALLAYQPTLTPTETIQRVEQTADNTASAPNGGWEMQFGHGRVNLANAIYNRTQPSTLGCFYGQVTNGRGDAIPKASVKCGGRLVQTRDDGMFRIANLAPDSYTIEVSVEGKTTSAKATIVAGADVNVTIQAGK